MIDGKTVKDIVWSVRLANKKLNHYSKESLPDAFPGLDAYRDGKTPGLRWPQMGPLDSETRLRTLVIDPGPRALSASAAGGRTVAFDKTTPAGFIAADETIAAIPDYPTSFPADHFDLDIPRTPLESLGKLRIEAVTGRLIVTPGFGTTVGVKVDGRVPSLEEPAAPRTISGSTMSRTGRSMRRSCSTTGPFSRSRAPGHWPPIPALRRRSAT